MDPLLSSWVELTRRLQVQGTPIAELLRVPDSRVHTGTSDHCKAEARPTTQGSGVILDALGASVANAGTRMPVITASRTWPRDFPALWQATCEQRIRVVCLPSVLCGLPTAAAIGSHSRACSVKSRSSA